MPLAKLERHLTKLPANITVKQMDSLESRLAALGTKVGPAAMPKGPLPRPPRCAACSAPCDASSRTASSAHTDDARYDPGARKAQHVYCVRMGAPFRCLLRNAA